MQDPTTPAESTDYLNAAKESAEAQVRIWIRSVLRETALQAVKQQLTVSHHRSSSDDEDGGSSGPVIIEMQPDTITNAQDLCRNVARKWKTKLSQMGHHDVARWIDEVVEAENGTLYEQVAETEGSGNAGIDPAKTLKTPAAAAVPDSARGDNKEPSKQSRESVCHTTTAWAKLRQIGNRDILAEDGPSEILLQDTLQQLDELGQQNSTYWPANQWDVVEEAAANISNRLHATVRSQRAENEEEVLQSSSHHEGSATSRTDYPEALQLFLARKRGGRKTSSSADGKPRAKKRPRASEEPQPLETPRPASRDNGHLRLSWKRDILAEDVWSVEEKAQLDAYLHDNHAADTEEEEPAALLLGALHDLGRFNFFHQLPEDFDEGMGILELWDEKQRRRRQQRAISVRLGDHTKARDEDTDWAKKRMSRVAHTTDTANRRWLDVDLGYCILENVDADTGNRTLYAFGSVELIFLDEDESID